MISQLFRETLNKLVRLMIRQGSPELRRAHHEQNQLITVRPELVEGLIQSFLSFLLLWLGKRFR